MKYKTYEEFMEAFERGLYNVLIVFEDSEEDTREYIYEIIKRNHGFKELYEKYKGNDQKLNGIISSCCSTSYLMYPEFL